MKHNLVEQFNSVGLDLHLHDKPLRGRVRNKDIFQMDIGRSVKGTRRTEWFEIYLGHESNVVQILDIDKKLNQILLLVREAEREFEETVQKMRSPEGIERQRNQYTNNRVKFTENAKAFIVTRKTPAGNRHFLMGVDERQLFVAQLKNGVVNINEARKQLGSTVQFHEGKRKMTPGRQGEWFFVRATEEQEKVLDLLLDKKRIFIHEKENIGTHAGRRRGNPHVADELVVLPNNVKIILEAQSTKWARENKDLKYVAPVYPVREKEVFVRGCIRHIDHKTIKYTRWHQVILNNEGDTANATQSWID